MEFTHIVLIALMVVLLALSAFFSASETSYTGMSKPRLRAMEAEESDRRISRTLANAEDFDRLLTTILVGNNIVNIASSTICTYLMCSIMMAILNDADQGDLWGTVAATLLMITLLLIIGEIAPKTIAKKNPEMMAIRMSGAISIAIRVLSPITAVFLKVNQGVTRVTGAEESDQTITEEELGLMIDEIQQEGTLEKSESELVKSALEFDDTQVGEICVPRVDMTTVSIISNVEDLKNLFIETEFSRIPVYEGSVDRIIGAVFFKDFFMKYNTKKNLRIADILRPVKFVPKEASIDMVMNELQKSKLHMAIVLDDYGGTFGLVTMEDLLEELVGEIWDESDDVKQICTRESDDSYTVLGDANLEEIMNKLGLDFDTEDYDSYTVSGYINYRLGRMPIIGDVVECDGVEMIVKSIRSRRIKEVSFILRSGQEDEEEKEEVTPEE
ncbi:MAG: hemolysin family protein [archaeon]|nr:hemolysin family protein [archaeon]